MDHTVGRITGCRQGSHEPITTHFDRRKTNQKSRNNSDLNVMTKMAASGSYDLVTWTNQSLRDSCDLDHLNEGEKHIYTYLRRSSTCSFTHLSHSVSNRPMTTSCLKSFCRRRKRHEVNTAPGGTTQATDIAVMLLLSAISPRVVGCLPNTRSL